jgi:hypothetical protein
VTARSIRTASLRPRTAGAGRIRIELVLVVLLASLSAAGGTASPAACGFSVVLSATPGSGTAPLLVHFNATVSSGTATEYDWTFGDGSFWNSSQPGADSPLHRYANPGQYLAQVRVLEPGCQAMGTATVGATPVVLSVSVSADPGAGTAPVTVDFSVAVTGGSGTYVSVLWTFGDGGVGSGVPVAYTYAGTGTFTYTVNVTDSEGHWVTASGTETVRSPAGVSSAGWLGLPSTAWELVAVALVSAAGVGALLFWVGRRSVGRTRASDLEPSTSPPTDSRSAPPPADPPLSADLAPARPAPAEIESGIDGASPPQPGFTSPVDSQPVRPTGEPAARLQLTQRVILHIGGQGRIGPDDVGLLALTQSGMASALGVGQNSITNVLRRLVAAGVLVQDVRHVSGQPRRLRVYRFSSRGEAVYRDVRTRSGREAPGDEFAHGAREANSGP